MRSGKSEQGKCVTMLRSERARQGPVLVLHINMIISVGGLKLSPVFEELAEVNR